MELSLRKETASALGRRGQGGLLGSVWFRSILGPWRRGCRGPTTPKCHRVSRYKVHPLLLAAEHALGSLRVPIRLQSSGDYSFQRRTPLLTLMSFHSRG